MENIVEIVYKTGAVLLTLSWCLFMVNPSMFTKKKKEINSKKNKFKS